MQNHTIPFLTKLIVVVISLFVYLPSIRSQEGKGDNMLNYEKIIEKITQKNIPFADKYRLHYKHLDTEKQINIVKQLIAAARAEDSTSHLVDLYFDMHNLSNTASEKSTINKTYLDSALLYVDETTDKLLLGKLYYTIGLYY